jgi:hypothetical protein
LLWKDVGAPRLELGRLTDDAVASLVEARLGGPVEQGALGWVITASQGNPLFVRELVQGALQDGTLARRGGLWRLTRRPRVSASLRELVEERMAALEANERMPVELLALAEPLRIDELTALAGLDASVRAEALGLIAKRGSRIRSTGRRCARSSGHCAPSACDAGSPRRCWSATRSPRKRRCGPRGCCSTRSSPSRPRC